MSVQNRGESADQNSNIIMRQNKNYVCIAIYVMVNQKQSL